MTETYYIEIEIDRYVGKDSKFYCVFGEKRTAVGVIKLMEKIREMLDNAIDFADSEVE